MASSLIYLPVDAEPSYTQGHADNAAGSDNPEAWTGMVDSWVPALGFQRDRLLDHGSYKHHGALAFGTPVFKANHLVIDEDDRYAISGTKTNLGPGGFTAICACKNVQGPGSREALIGRDAANNHVLGWRASIGRIRCAVGNNFPFWRDYGNESQLDAQSFHVWSWRWQDETRCRFGRDKEFDDSDVDSTTPTTGHFIDTTLWTHLFKSSAEDLEIDLFALYIFDHWKSDAQILPWVDDFLYPFHKKPFYVLLPETAGGLVADGTVASYSSSSINADVLTGSVNAGGTPSIATFSGIDAKVSTTIFVGATVATPQLIAVLADVAPGLVNAGGTIAEFVGSSIDANVLQISYAGGTISTSPVVSIDADIAPGLVNVGGTVAVASWVAIDASVAATVIVGGTVSQFVSSAIDADIAPGLINAGGTVAAATWLALDADVYLIVFAGGTVAAPASSAINADVLPGSTAAGGTPSLASWTSLDASVAGTVTAGGTVAVASMSSVDGDVAPGLVNVGGTVAAATWSVLDADVYLIVFADGIVAVPALVAISADVVVGTVNVGGTVSIASWVSVDAAVRPGLLAPGTVAPAAYSATDANVTVGTTTVGGTPATAVWVAVNARSPSGDQGVWAPAILYGDETR